MTKLESQLRDEISAYLKKQKWVYKIKIAGSAVQAKGTPDFLCCVGGIFVAFELKRECGGSYGMTKPQQIRVRQIEAAGGFAYCVSKLFEVQCVVTEILSGRVPDRHPETYAPIATIQDARHKPTLVKVK